MRHVNSLQKKIVLSSQIILLVLTAIFIGCGPDNQGGKNGTNQGYTLLGTNFYELELSKGKYNNLKSFLGSNEDSTSKLVFQFLFSKDSLNGYPTLTAYASRARNQFHQAGPGSITLSHLLDTTHRASLTVPNKFVLGDQQISISDIENLKEGAGITETDNFTLIFKPKQKVSSKNIYYEVCIKKTGADNPYCGGNAATETQPSPPADAY